MDLISKEPVITLEKLDLAAYYDNFSSLGDRVKSNKRQRLPDTPSKKGRREQQIVDAGLNTTPKNSESVRKSSVDRNVTPTPAKRTKYNHQNSNAISPIKSSAPSFSTSYTSSHSLSSSSTPQLSSQNSSLPASQKLEAMLDELFDLGQAKHSKHRSKTDDEDEESDSEEERHIKQKHKNNKMNGESSHEISKLFDITLSGATLAHFVGTTAKLKRNDQMQAMPVTKLINLLQVLTQQLAVQSASLKDKRRKSTEDGDEDEDTNITNSASMMKKFESCCDCCCVALYVLSSKGKSIYVCEHDLIVDF